MTPYAIQLSTNRANGYPRDPHFLRFDTPFMEKNPD
jgi:hypothetical protein